MRPFGLRVERLYWASDIRMPGQVRQQIEQKIANEQAALAAQAGDRGDALRPAGPMTRGGAQPQVGP